MLFSQKTIDCGIFFDIIQNMRQFQIPSNQLDNLNSYRLRRYERAEYSSGWKSYEHMHSFTEIFFITSGEGVFHTKDEDIPIHKGMIIVNTPSVPHTEFSSEENPLSYALFAVDNLTFTLQNASQQKTFSFDFYASFDTLFEMLAIIEREYDYQQPFWQYAVLNEFNNFMLFLLRNTQLVTLPFDSSAKPNSLSQIHLFLRSRYQENITLDLLSNLYFLNKYYIAHSFKKKYGCSIIKFLNTLRCTEAKSLLESTDLSITEIAITVGYNSSSHFTESYKKIIGETPAQTRKNFYKTQTE